MTTMTCDGYVATIELDEEAGVFHGEVINTRDVLTFQGRTLDELKAAFADTIADYVEWCRERGKEPQRPYSGNFTVRISPELHRRVATAAARGGKRCVVVDRTRGSDRPIRCLNRGRVFAAEVKRHRHLAQLTSARGGLKLA